MKAETPVDQRAAAPDDPESDHMAPVLESIQFDPPEVRDGDVTNLRIGIRDNLSGVRSVSGTIRSPSGSAIVPFAVQADAGATAVEVRITIPVQAETGVWFLTNFQAYDRANNSLITAFTEATVPRGGTLMVTSRESDSTPPTVRRVWVEMGSIRSGERNPIRVAAEDDRSGIASVTGTFRSPSGLAAVSFGCLLNADTGNWEGDVILPANADCGEWTLQQLRLVDHANNSAIFLGGSPEVGSVGFMLLGAGDCDSVAPTLESVHLSPRYVSNQAASEVLLTASVRDDESGLSTVFGYVNGPVATNGQVPRISFSCAQIPNEPRAPWTCKITVPQYSARGLWKVAMVQVVDNARNARTYHGADPVLVGAAFEVE